MPANGKNFSAMKDIKLRNGSDENEIIVRTTMMALWQLESEGMSGMLALYGLRELCRDGSAKLYKDTRKKLQDLGLLQQDGQPDDSVRNVVLLAVQGEGVAWISNPLGQSTMPALSSAVGAACNITFVPAA